MANFTPKTLTHAIFGEFNRYELTVELTRFGTIDFCVFDAESCHDYPYVEMVRQCESIDDALQGLDHHFNDNIPVKGDWVINMGTVPGKFHSVYHTGNWVLKDPATGQRWVAPKENCMVIK